MGKTGKIRHKVLEAIKHFVKSLDFLNRLWKSPKDFTWRLSMIKESSQNVLVRYFLKTEEIMRMSQQAFNEARKKIRWEVLRESLTC